MQALEEAGLLTITRVNDRPHSIKPGRPVYRHAFGRLTGDHVLAVKLDLASLDGLVQRESQSIDKYETELQRAVGLSKDAATALAPRIRWLGDQLLECQAKLERYESERRALRKTLQRAH